MNIDKLVRSNYKQRGTIFLLYLFACASSMNLEANQELLIQASPSNLAPYDTNSPAGNLALLQGLVLGQLLSVDQNYNLVPGIIDSWKWSPGSKKYILQLKKNLKFHNGKPVTARDLEYSLLRGFYSKGRSYFRMTLKEILGADEIQPGSPYRTGQTKGVQIVDDTTLELQIKSKNSNFLFNLVRPYYSIVPYGEFKPDHLTWKSLPIGVGPYWIKKAFDGKATQLERVDKKPTDNKPSLITIFTDRADLSQKIDLSFIDRPDLKQHYIGERPSLIYQMQFSYYHPLGKNKEFRSAVAATLDRAKIAETVIGGVATDSVFANELLRSKSIASSDVNQAKSTFEKLRVKQIKSLVYGYKTTEDAKKNPRISEIIRQFKLAGVELIPIPTISKHGDLKESEECPLLFVGIVSDFIDPTKMVAHFNQESPYVYNRPNPPDPHFEKLYARAIMARDKSVTWDAVKEIDELIRGEHYAVPLVESRPVYYYDPERIESFGSQPQPVALFVDRITLKRAKNKRNSI